MWGHGLSGNTDPFEQLISLARSGPVTELNAGFAYASMRGAIMRLLILVTIIDR